MSRLTISLLGPFRVEADGEPVIEFATAKTQALLAYLVVEADRPQRRDVLASLLWPEYPQDKARQNFRKALSNLRQAIRGLAGDDEPFLLVDREMARFNPACDHWLDVEVFRSLVNACRHHRHRRRSTCLACIRRLERMVDLYQGEFLEQFSLADSVGFEEWASLEREWFHREMMGGLSSLADYYERRGDLERALRYTRRQVEMEPWHEGAHRRLITLLARDGQRSAALAQYEACRERLAAELNVEPTGETTRLYERIRDESDWPPAILHNLPPEQTPFVGREQERAELVDLLADPDCRLVTLVGPGGIGKTRLALQVAREQVGLFAHGVYVAPLLSAGSPRSVASVIANGVGVSFPGGQPLEKQLLDYLCEKEMLLVLDSMEHLLSSSPSIPDAPLDSDVEGTDLLVEILRQAPGVVLLVTSRERLNLREEWLYELGSLAYPAETETGLTVAELLSYSAVQLFVQCARRVRRQFSLTDAEGPAVVRICQLVGGMPLGIELAAAWVRIHACQTIAQEIERNLDLLATRLRNVPARHRSIRATFEYSWQRLTGEERSVLARLSVFRGGFEREAAIVVTGASPAILDALLDKSLLTRSAAERYDLHPLLQQYASEKLGADPGEDERTRTRHARYLAAYLEQQEAHLEGAEALAGLALEIENGCQAWQWAVSQGMWDEVDRSVKSLYRFFDIQSRFQEGIDLLDQAINRWVDGREGENGILGRILSRQGVLYGRLGLYQEAQRLLEQGLALSEQCGMLAEQAFNHLQLANVVRHQGQYEETERLARHSLTLFREVGDQLGVARALFLMGLARYRIGHVDRAEALLGESLSISREIDNSRAAMSALNVLGDIACHRGDFDQARSVFQECLTLSRELGDQFKMAVYLNNLGTLLHVLQEYQSAGALYQESLDICRRIGDQIGQAIALSNLGRVAHERGAYLQARACHLEGLGIGRRLDNSWTVMACLNNLGRTACAMDDLAAARTYLIEALQIAVETQAVVVLVEILVDVAVLFDKEGQRQRAAAILDLVRQHPVSEQAVQEKADRLLRELEGVRLTPISKPLAEVAAEILAELAA